MVSLMRNSVCWTEVWTKALRLVDKSSPWAWRRTAVRISRAKVETRGWRTARTSRSAADFFRLLTRSSVSVRSRYIMSWFGGDKTSRFYAGYGLCPYFQAQHWSRNSCDRSVIVSHVASFHLLSIYKGSAGGPVSPKRSATMQRGGFSMH